MKVKSVSYSSDRKLRRCERQYSYRYDEGLKARTKSKGLFMGSVMHELQQAHYKGEGWQKHFKLWKKESWGRLFEEEREMYIENGFSPEFAFDLFSHYVERWEPEDKNWQVVLVEQRFELSTKLGIPVIFQADLIVKDKRDGVYCLVETKNNKEIPTAEQRILAPQIHSYCYLLSKIRTEQFPNGIKIGRVIWNYLRTAPVPKPSLNKDGSVSKRKINTDQRMYQLFLKESKIHPKTEDERIGIENTLNNLPETLALLRVTNRPNLKVGEMFVRQWLERARRAKGIKTPLHNWSRDCQWTCDYKLLCEADILGKDRTSIIRKNFVTKIGDTEVN
jgi:hypothetical protein